MSNTNPTKVRCRTQVLRKGRQCHVPFATLVVFLLLQSRWQVMNGERTGLWLIYSIYQWPLFSYYVQKQHTTIFNGQMNPATFICSQNLWIIWLSSLVTMSVTGDDYIRNASCALNYISTLLLLCYVDENDSRITSTWSSHHIYT